MRHRNVLAGIAAAFLTMTIAGSGAADAATPPPKPTPHIETPQIATPQTGVNCSQIGATTENRGYQMLCVNVDNYHFWVPVIIARGAKAALHLRLNEARYACNQPIIQIVFDTETLVGTEWTPKQDDGQTQVQFHFIGNGAGPGGLWGTVEAASGGENRLRVNVATQVITTWDMIRLIRKDTGIASSGKPIIEPCV